MDKTVIGWREYVDLPDFGLRGISAKVDTGAATSSLHAEKIEEFKKGSKRFVRFYVKKANNLASIDVDNNHVFVGK